MPALKSAENSRADICFNSFLGGTGILFRAASLSLVSGKTSIVALSSSAFVIRFRLGNSCSILSLKAALLVVEVDFICILGRAEVMSPDASQVFYFRVPVAVAGAAAGAGRKYRRCNLSFSR